MTHRERHPDYVDGCFGCKLGSLNFGMVPGGYRDVNSGTMFDRDQLPKGLPTNEEVMDRRSRFAQNVING